MSTLLNSKYIMLVCLLIGLFATNYEVVRAQTQFPPYQVIIIVDTAKMRTGPGANFRSNGYAKKGDLLTVYQTSPNGEWLLVHQTPNLWVSILQVKIVNKSSTIKTKPALTQANDVSVQEPSGLESALILVGFIILGVFLLGRVFSPKVRAVDHVYEPSGPPSTDDNGDYEDEEAWKEEKRRRWMDERDKEKEREQEKAKEDAYYEYLQDKQQKEREREEEEYERKKQEDYEQWYEWKYGSNDED